MRGFVMFAGAVLVLACSDSTDVRAGLCPDADVPLCTSGDSTRAVIRPMTSDAGTRSLSALGNEAARTAIGTELTAIGAAIAAGNVADANAAVDRATAALATARQSLATHPGDAPDLAAIELALIQIRLAIK